MFHQTTKKKKKIERRHLQIRTKHLLMKRHNTEI